MARELAWTFDMNTPPISVVDVNALAQSFAWQLKQFLMASGWTVIHSCDSNQAASTSDLWVDMTAIVFADALTAHSHVTLVGAGGLYWLSIDCQAASAGTLRLVWHREQPSLPSNPLLEPLVSASQIALADVRFIRGNVTNEPKFRFGSATDGSFWASVDYLKTYRSPFWIAFRRLKDSFSRGQGEYPPDALIIAPAWRDYGSGALASLNALAPAALHGWEVGGNPTSGGFHALALLDVSDGTVAIGQGSPMNRDDFSGMVMNSPLHIWCATTGNTAYMGRIPDMYLSGNTMWNCISTLGEWLSLGKYVIAANSSLI